MQLGIVGDHVGLDELRLRLVDVALRELGHDQVAVALALVDPRPLAERRDRALQCVVEPWILPQCALPDVGEHRGAVELFALEADIGRDVLRARLEDRARLQFLKLGADGGQALAGRRRRGGALARFLFGFLAVEPGAELALKAIKPVGIITRDMQRKVLGVNGAYERLLGYTRTEIERLDGASLMRPEDTRRAHDMLEKLKTGEISSYSMERCYRRKDGSSLWTDVITSAIRDENGRLVATATMINDISQRKAAEQAQVDPDKTLAEAVAVDPQHAPAFMAQAVLGFNEQLDRIGALGEQIKAHRAAERELTKASP